MLKFLSLMLALIGIIEAQSTPLMAGGIVDVDPTTAEIQAEAKFAFNMISQSINSIYVQKIGKVIKAQSQVVSGVKYYLTIEVQETSCRTNAVDAANCAVTKTQICEAVVWSRVWLESNPRELLSFQCRSA